MKEIRTGVYQCDKCGGSGFKMSEEREIDIKGIPHTIPPATMICSKCWGFGELDWIEIVVGKDLQRLMMVNTNAEYDPKLCDYDTFLKHE